MIFLIFFSVVGSSGGGKSSIINLILRFYDVGQGTIFIDQRDIKDYNIKSLHQYMG